LGQIDEVDAAVGCDNHVGRCRVFANQTVRLARMLSRVEIYRGGLRVWIKQR
jgi:hypothetical protein